MAKKNNEPQINEKEDSNKLLKGILLALALKEEKWENKSKVLKTGGLKQNEINELIGLSENAKRVRKHREKKKQTKGKGFLSKLIPRGEK